MFRFNVKCGELRCVIMAPTAYKAAMDSMDFAAGKKLGDRFYIREITVKDGVVSLDPGRLSYGFNKIARAAGWVIE